MHFCLAQCLLVGIFVLIGNAADGTEAQGRILVPEVAHDSEIDEYVVGCHCLTLSVSIPSYSSCCIV